MRTAVPGLVTPHPIGRPLPALYLDDDFTQRLTAGLDEVLAPVLLTLDCLDAYLDLDAGAGGLPRLARRLGGDGGRRELAGGAAARGGPARGRSCTGGAAPLAGLELAVRLLTGGTRR